MILMFGDVHGNFRHVLPVVQKEKPKAIIFLGDLQAQKPLEQELADVMLLTEVWWIHGNHDTDSRKDHDNLFCSALADRNLHGRIVEIDGVRVAGLGGVFRERVWYPQYSAEAEPHYANYDSYLKQSLIAERWKEYRRMIKPTLDAEGWQDYQRMTAAGWTPENLPMPPFIGKALTHKSTIFHEDWLQLYGQCADILVTHEAPTCHPHGFAAVDALAQSMRVKYVFHGHHHDRLNYAAHEKRLGFSAHGVGLRGVSDMYGGMILAGMHDENRRAGRTE